MSNVILFCDVQDPKRESVNIRDLFREALTRRDVSAKVATIVSNGEDLGHKVLIWNAALEIVEADLGERLEPFSNMTRYEKGAKLRTVVRERLEVDKHWKVTGNKAPRLT
jgi:hypothetical protein